MNALKMELADITSQHNDLVKVEQDARTEVINWNSSLYQWQFYVTSGFVKLACIAV
jgi:hypothetical protein